MSRSLLGADAVCTADCLGPCGNSNVVVVLLPSAAGRRRGGRPVWLGFVPSRESLGDITGWIGAEVWDSPPSRTPSTCTGSPRRRLTAMLGELLHRA